MLSFVGVLGVFILVLISRLYNRQFVPRPVSDHFDFVYGSCFGVRAGYGSVYCLCNETFCDKIPTVLVREIRQDVVVTFTSSSEGLRFRGLNFTLKSPASFPTSSPKAEPDVIIRVNREVKFQSVLGFGGAFTDAAGINLNKLKNETRKKLIHSYFGPDSIEYSVGRIPIGSSDFSTRCYSYAEKEDDFDLESFQLVDEDFRLKIPFALEALRLSRGDLKLFASPWSPPNWMKTNGGCAGYGRIKGDPNDLGEAGKYYKSWAKYFVRFLEEYEKLGISFWGVTAQNEPTDGYIPFFSFNCLGFTAKEQRDFIKNYLGPALKGRTAASSSNSSTPFSSLKLLILDDNRVRAKDWVNTVLSDPIANSYVDGTAIHWYWNVLSPPTVTTEIHDAFPSKLILASEACDGWTPFEHKVWLGDWSRAEDYAKSIVEDLNNWVVGWTDWNMALDMQGGPNWAENYVDAPIIVNAEKNEFYRQPMFYVMGHFSKFVPPSSVVVEAEVTKGDKIGVVAASYAKEGRGIQVVVIHNQSDWPQRVQIKDCYLEKEFFVDLPEKSIMTMIWPTD